MRCVSGGHLSLRHVLTPGSGPRPSEEKELDVIPIAARCRLVLMGLATVAATALLAVPPTASAAPATASTATPTGATGCRATPVTHPFAPWSDAADYFLAPDGGLEQGGSGWTLRGRATVTPGNEPWKVAAAGDRNGLSLPGGSSATTAPFCIGLEHRTMRFFAVGARASSLDVDVLYSAVDGGERSVRIANAAGVGAWSPSDVVPMVVNELAAHRGNAMSVRLRFAPHGASAWTIDDVYIDPFRGKL
jgi:hypothetical protein